MKNNAKEYMAFDALKGLREVIKQKEKCVLKKNSVVFDSEADLKEKLVLLVPGSRATVVYYWEGEFVSVTGRVSWISYGMQRLRGGHRELRFGDIVNIKDAPPAEF